MTGNLKLTPSVKKHLIKTLGLLVEYLHGSRCILKGYCKTKKEKVIEIFKNLSLFVYGGVNFEPYKRIFLKLIGKEINTIEYYPASEGFLHTKTTKMTPHFFCSIILKFFMSLWSLNQFDKNSLGA